MHNFRIWITRRKQARRASESNENFVYSLEDNKSNDDDSLLSLLRKEELSTTGQNRESRERVRYYYHTHVCRGLNIKGAQALIERSQTRVKENG